MKFDKIQLNPRVSEVNDRIETLVGRYVRGRDALKSKLHVGGRTVPYDDASYEFVGGAHDGLRKKHYDKSLRLLWKAEKHAPFLGHRDCTPLERQVSDMALKSMSAEEKEAHHRITLPEYKELLNREYSPREKQAIVNILAAIGHGEAYAWFVSAALINEVKSTGARTALTMQVMEEAKHFVVLRDLLKAFDVPIRPMLIWEYLLLEQVASAKGLEKFFGMNILVEGIALSFFGLMSEHPGLEILRLFHLDESRHTALPGNYHKEFPLTAWQQRSPVKGLRRLSMLLPALALIPNIEPEMAELGIDAFEFGGSVVRKVATLAEKSGFNLPLPREKLFKILDTLFDTYCARTRPGHSHRIFTDSETTRGVEQIATEKEIFGKDAVHAA